MNKIYVALDTETTGLKSENDAIIEVAAVKFRGEQVLDSWSSLVNPGRELPLKVERLTGITREAVRNAPRIEQVARHIARFVGEHPVVGHSIENDMAFLRQQSMLLTNPTIDTDELARIVMPHAARYTLKQLAAELDIPLPEHHRALADAQAAMHLFLALCQRATQLDVNTLQEINRAAEKSNWGLRDVFKEILRDAGRHAFTGSSIGEQLRAKGMIKNNRLTVLDDVSEDFAPGLRPSPYQKEIDCDAIIQLFDKGGALAEHFPGYERRTQQIEMLQAVCAAFNDNTHLLVEAGTGTGKCLTADAWITLRSGQRMQVGALVQASSTLTEPILCVTPSGKLAYQKIKAMHANGVRRVWRLKTRLGRTITATANHPFLLLSGWKLLCDLKVGERIATIRQLPAGAEHFLSHEAFVAGAMLGDGGCVHLDSLNFTNFDTGVVSAVTQAVAQLGNVYMAATETPGHYGFRRQRLLGHERSGLTILLEKLGVAGHDAHTKYIPSVYFRADTETLSHLLAGLWITDGSIEIRDGHPSIASASERMIREIQHLLLKLGIIGRVRYKRVALGDRQFDSWVLTISDLNSKRAFRQTIGTKLVGEKKERLSDWWQGHEQQQFNPNDDLIPTFGWTLIDQERQRANKSWYAIRKHCVVASDRTREISRAKMLAIGEFLHSPKLIEIATSDLYWDRIVSIEFAGEQPTFDLTMEGAPNFVANDIVVHNSMAYLVPAIHFAVANSRPVVISTNTINLQDQLIEKDIPDLRKILDIEFRAMVMKGRSNYLCRHRFEQFQQRPHTAAHEVRLLAKILAWLTTTMTGDRAELSLSYDEDTAWAAVCADETCNAATCPYFQKGTCFFFRSRQRAESAHLIVVNHALLLSDMAVGNHLLPEFKHLIVDEAHHLEARATEALSVEVKQAAIESLLAELGTGRTGLLSGLAVAIRASDAHPEVREQLSDLVDSANEYIDRALRAVYPFFNHLTEFLRAQHPPKGDFDAQVRLVSGLRAQPAWSTNEILCEALTSALSRVSSALEKMARVCDDQHVLEGDNRLYELASYRQRVDELRVNLNAIVNEPQPSGIYWATINAESGDVALNSAPLHVGELLQKNIFKQKDCVILTSATLRSVSNFQYIRERLSLQEAQELALDSPFEYQKSTLLYIPTDVPEPDTPNYNKIVHDTLVSLCRATQGRTLILFTSKSQLRRTYEAIGKPLEQAGILVMAQYMDGSRRQLLENFRTMPRSVLLGTRSFWEGVDVVGDALSCLVITRLPFAVPSDPIIAARSETFNDAFNEYMVPQAVLSFRQGFGRLIRSTSDRGVVVMLDRRVLTKGYGKSFIASLPKCTEQRGLCKDLPSAAEQWLQ